MRLIRLALAAAAYVAFTSASAAAPVDLSSWMAEGGGNWNLAPGNNSVLQTRNGDPTVFFNGVNSQGLALSGTIEVQTTGDNDFIGFVLGYNSGDLSNAAANYLLIDWKQGNQGFFGCTGSEGLAISSVTGTLRNNSGAWCHDPSNNVTEIQRATNLGNTGWADNTVYTFDLIYTSTFVQVKVNGVTELSIAGAFSNGSFGFYNYSQSTVEYAGIQQVVAPPPPSAIPLPAAVPMLASALALLFGFGRLRTRRA